MCETALVLYSVVRWLVMMMWWVVGHRQSIKDGWKASILDVGTLEHSAQLGRDELLFLACISGNEYDGSSPTAEVARAGKGGRVKKSTTALGPGQGRGGSKSATEAASGVKGVGLGGIAVHAVRALRRAATLGSASASVGSSACARKGHPSPNIFEQFQHGLREFCSSDRAAQNGPTFDGVGLLDLRR